MPEPWLLPLPNELSDHCLPPVVVLVKINPADPEPVCVINKPSSAIADEICILLSGLTVPTPILPLVPLIIKRLVAVVASCIKKWPPEGVLLPFSENSAHLWPPLKILFKYKAAPPAAF